MAAADELRIVHREQRVRAVDEFRVEDHFDAIVFVVEQVAVSQVGEHRVGRVVDHVMGDDRRQFRL